MNSSEPSPFEMRAGSRREFFALAAATAAAPIASAGTATRRLPRVPAGDLKNLEPYFTPASKFRDVSRGNPLPHSLPADRKAAVGLTRESWRLEVVADPEHPARLQNPLTSSNGSALDFEALLNLGKARAVRFAKVMTCLNIGCPLGMGLWEGVPLRDVLWLTRPRADLRRVWYLGYHNDDPKQVFRSSLPVDRILEDPPGLPPVILCYKLNGDWLDSERGGPVRVVVPEAYGFKSIKWVQRIVLSNLFHANDTYADGNNDVDSTLKTFAATLGVPNDLRPDEGFTVTGYAQVGTSGLTKVQVWLEPKAAEHAPGDPHFITAPWQDAQVLPPPEDWGALPGGRIPGNTMGFDRHGRPTEWPMRLARVRWAARFPGQHAGDYTLRCRTIDANGQAQPMPRPFQKSGHAAIEAVDVRVKS